MICSLAALLAMQSCSQEVPSAAPQQDLDLLEAGILAEYRQVRAEYKAKTSSHFLLPARVTVERGCKESN